MLFKKFVLEILFILILLAPIAGRASEDLPKDLLSIRVRSLSYGMLSRVTQSPRHIAAIVRRRVKYRDDFKDEWVAGEDVWNQGYGDCEDFALCIRDACNAVRCRADVYVLFQAGGESAHAIVVGKAVSGYWYSSNGYYAQVASLNEVRLSSALELGWNSDEVEMVKANSKEEYLGQVRPAQNHNMHPLSAYVRPEKFVQPETFINVEADYACPEGFADRQQVIRVVEAPRYVDSHSN